MPFDTLTETRVALQELHNRYGELGERMALVIQRATKAELEVDKLKELLKESAAMMSAVHAVLELNGMNKSCDMIGKHLESLKPYLQ